MSGTQLQELQVNQEATTDSGVVAATYIMDERKRGSNCPKRRHTKVWSGEHPVDADTMINWGKWAYRVYQMMMYQRTCLGILSAFLLTIDYVQMVHAV